MNSAYFLHTKRIGWTRIALLTLLAVIFGIPTFQTAFHPWISILLLFVIHWLSLGTAEWAFDRLYRSTEKQWVSSLRYFFFPLLSSVLAFLLLRVQPTFGVAHFSSYLVVGIVLSSLDYLLSQLEDLSLVSDFQRKNHGASPLESSAEKLVLTNTKGRTVFAVPTDQIICIEAMDNYVTIFYSDDEGATRKATERLSMKQAESHLATTTTPFLRVHKSYLVRVSAIQQVQGRAQNHKLTLKGLDHEIPVSRRLKIQEMIPALDPKN